MLKKLSIVVVFIILIAILYSGSQKSKSKMTDDDFVNLYVKLAETAEQYLADSLKLHTEQENVFSDSKFTKEDFDLYMRELDKKPEQWANVWEKISTELEKRKPQEKADSLNCTTPKNQPLPEPPPPPGLDKK